MLVHLREQLSGFVLMCKCLWQCPLANAARKYCYYWEQEVIELFMYALFFTRNKINRKCLVSQFVSVTHWELPGKDRHVGILQASFCSCRQDNHQGSSMNASWDSKPWFLPEIHHHLLIFRDVQLCVFCFFGFFGFFRAEKSSAFLIQRQSGNLSSPKCILCISRADGSQGGAWLLLPCVPGSR